MLLKVEFNVYYFLKYIPGSFRSLLSRENYLRGKGKGLDYEDFALFHLWNRSMVSLFLYRASF